MKKKSSIYHMAVCALMAAVMCVVGPMSIPIGSVPISLTNMVVCLAACLLGMRWGSVSVLVYLALGACGLPVFSSYSGGLAKFVGPTGGYLIGDILLALIAGFFVVKFGNKIGWNILGMVLGTVVLYAFGTVWFVILMQCSIWTALLQCVFPFLIFDALKIVFAAVVGSLVRKQLVKAKLIEE
jgi:biotin transport system substrate-specific component